MDYQIQSGDNLTKIAKAHGATTSAEINKFINDVAKLNNIKNVNLIFTGHTLKLPGDVFGNGEAQTPEAQAAKEEEKAVQFNEWSSKNVQEYAKIIDGEADLSNPSKETENALEKVGTESFAFADMEAMTKEDGKIDKSKYQEASKEFAKDIVESWNKDKEEGVNLEEYTDTKLASLGITDAKLDEMCDDKAEALIDSIESNFNFLDINGNNVIEDSEMQNVFAALDLADGNTDGNIQFGTYASMQNILNPETLEQVKNNVLNE